MSLTQVNAVEQFFPVVLFVMFCKVVLIFECVHKVRSNESYSVLLFIMLHKMVLTFECGDGICSIFVWEFCRVKDTCNCHP